MADSPATAPRWRKLKAVLPIGVFVGACAASALYGAPARLRGAALGWTPLLHVERAAAVLAAVGTVWLVGWRALHGHFPIKFGNIEYVDELKASAETVDSHERRLKLPEDYLELAEPPEDGLD